MRFYRIQFVTELVIALHQFGHWYGRHTAWRCSCCGWLAFGCFLFNIGKLRVLHCADGVFALGVLGTDWRKLFFLEPCQLLLCVRIRLFFLGGRGFGGFCSNGSLQLTHSTRSVLILGIELGQRFGRILGGFFCGSGFCCGACSGLGSGSFLLCLLSAALQTPTYGGDCTAQNCTANEAVEILFAGFGVSQVKTGLRTLQHLLGGLGNAFGSHCFAS